MTPPRDFERFAENLNIWGGNEIKDRDSFDETYHRYLTEEPNNGSFLDDNKREKVWLKYSTRFKIKDERLHKEKGGKSLARDRRKTASVVVTKRKVYTDATRQDLKGYDTQIKSRAFYVTRNKKSIMVHRDRLGRFCKA